MGNLAHTVAWVLETPSEFNQGSLLFDKCFFNSFTDQVAILR